MVDTTDSPPHSARSEHTKTTAIIFSLGAKEFIEVPRIRLNSFCKANITLIPQLDKDTTIKENYRLVRMGGKGTPHALLVGV